MLTQFSRLLVLATAALLCVAAYHVADYRGTDDGDAGERLLLEPEQDRGELATGRHDIEFPITNTGIKPRRLVGASGPSCGSICCWVPMEVPDVVTIAPGETFHFRCRLEVKQSGPFEAPITLYLDDAGLRAVTLRVRGMGVPNGEKAHAANARP